MSSTLHAADLAFIQERGSELAKIERQLEILRHPPSPIRLERPCLIDDGIARLDRDQPALEDAWSQSVPELHQLVPSSGAATRMFSFLPTPRGKGSVSPADLERRAEAGEPAAIQTRSLLQNLGRLPFSAELEELTAAGDGSLEDIARHDPGLVLGLLADRSGLNLAARPKGLLPFHRYDSGSRTAFEEHLWASARYLSDGSSPVRIHFTVSAEHETAFRSAAERVRPEIERQLGIDFGIGFSLQDPVTDTIAIDSDGNPVRDASGRLLFRPGGHGSLLVNLERLAHAGSGLVFLKNIDNVAPVSRQPELAGWKRTLAGHLHELRRRTFELLDRLAPESADPESLAEARDFLKREFAIQDPLPPAESSIEEAARKMRDRLDRPLRVCGMVVNRGEPGGGPFWVRRSGGSVDGQIVEGSQIDGNDPLQQSIWSSSTHFNPVDLACSLHDRRGRHYDLQSFVDPDTYFVATKELDGRQIRVLERPGLWNGAMARWNTAFVEVPEQTFTPVKTLLDLLRPAHRT